MPQSPVREITALDLEPIRPTGDLSRQNGCEQLGDDIDLNFPGADTQYATHALHPYVAAINPPLARTLIDHYVPVGESVLDPFCGGGGVLVETLRGDRRPTGYDINPLAVCISRAKTTHVPTKRTMPEYVRILDESQVPGEVDTSRIPSLIRNWYTEESLAPLCRLQSAIGRTSDPQARDLFLVALSATARDVMLTYRGEIRLRRLQGRDLERFRPNVIASFRKRAEMAMTRAAQLPGGAHAEVALLDVRLLDRPHAFHSVVSSPPYADDTNGVGYFQFSRNMMYWLGIPLAEQETQRRRFLGGATGGQELGSLPPSATLHKIAEIISDRSNVHHHRLVLFYRDYFHALDRIAKSVRHRVIIIIGDRVLARTAINNGHITTDLMRVLHFELEHYYSRELRKKRIANLGGDGGGTAIEHILVYRRQGFA